MDDEGSEKEKDGGGYLSVEMNTYTRVRTPLQSNIISYLVFRTGLSGMGHHKKDNGTGIEKTHTNQKLVGLLPK